MTYQEFDQLTSGLASLATIIALVVGGIWAYRRFVRTREAYPKIDFSVDIALVKKQSGFWLVEATAYIENKGQVRHSMREFTFDILYLRASDPIESKDPFLVFFPHKATEGSWLPPCWGETFIEPGCGTRYSCAAMIPEDATIAMIHGKFFYQNKEWHTSDKLIAVGDK